MCTGKELITALPTEKDFKEVPNEIQRVLKYIFEDESAEIDRVSNYCKQQIFIVLTLMLDTRLSK